MVAGSRGGAVLLRLSCVAGRALILNVALWMQRSMPRATRCGSAASTGSDWRCLRQGEAERAVLHRHRLPDLELVHRRFSRSAATMRPAAWIARWSMRTWISAPRRRRSMRRFAHLHELRYGSMTAAVDRACRGEASECHDHRQWSSSTAAASFAARSHRQCLRRPRRATPARHLARLARRSTRCSLAGRCNKTEALGCYITDPASIRRK